MSRAAQDPADRYFAKVDRKGPDECWEWTAACFSQGYGAFRSGDKQTKAHRFGYQLAFGPIPPGLIVCHTCDNRKCQNPGHMFLGTHLDNARDRDNKQRGTHLRVYRVRMPHARGKRNGNSKLTDQDVRDIRARYAQGETQTSIAAAYGLTQGNVGHICRRLTWTHVP